MRPRPPQGPRQWAAARPAQLSTQLRGQQVAQLLHMLSAHLRAHLRDLRGQQLAHLLAHLLNQLRGHGER